METAGLLLDPLNPVEWSHPLSRGLQSCWMVPPNPGLRGGLTLRDLARGGRRPNDGVMTNGATWGGRRGRPGGHGSLVLDGSDDYVNVADSPSLSWQNGFTVALWLRRTALSGSHSGWIGKYESPLEWCVGDTSTNNTLTILIYDQTNFDYVGRQLSISGTLNAMTRWYHLAFTWTAGATSSNLAIYLDGVAQSTSDFSGTAAFVALRDTSSPLTIGKSTNWSVNCFAGWMDDIRLYNYRLSANQVWQLYDSSRRGHLEAMRWLNPRVWTWPSGGGAPLVAGTASLVSSGPAGIAVTATDATGGSGVYTYQWQRNVNGGSYSDLSNGGGVTGATLLGLTDGSATAGNLYGYRLVYTDSMSATATGNPITAQVYTGGALTGGGSSRGRWQRGM